MATSSCNGPVSLVSRTRSADYGNIQASILQTTSDLFATRGYAASSISDIAEACGCSKSRLYHYFKSKEEILATMLTEHVDRLLEGCHAITAEIEEPEASFRRLIRFFMEIYAVSRSKHVVLLTCMEFLPDAKRKEVIAKERELISFVRDLLKRLRPERARAPKALQADTMLFFGMINWTYTWFNAKGPISPQELADRSVDLFLNGFLSGSVASTKKRPGVKLAVG